VEWEIRQQSEFLEGFQSFNRLRFVYDKHRADTALRIRLEPLIEYAQSPGLGSHEAGSKLG